MKKSLETYLTRKSVVCMLAILCCFLWGSAFPSIKIGYQLFQISGDSVASQLLFAGWRFTLAGILAILAASLLFKQEKLTLAKLLGCLFGFSGVIFINLNGSKLDMNMHFIGEGFILIAALSNAFSSVLIKNYSQKEAPVVLSGYQFLVGGLLLSFIGVCLGGKVTGFTLSSSALLLYLGFISATAYTLWGILLKYNSVGKVAIFGFMNPVFGVLLSALLLGERGQAFGLTGIVALLLVCIGIYIVNSK